MQTTFPGSWHLLFRLGSLRKNSNLRPKQLWCLSLVAKWKNTSNGSPPLLIFSEVQFSWHSKIEQGLGLMSLFGDLFHITFKYLLEIVSPIVGWCSIGTFTNPCFASKLVFLDNFSLVSSLGWGHWVRSRFVNSLAIVVFPRCTLGQNFLGVNYSQLGGLFLFLPHYFSDEPQSSKLEINLASSSAWGLAKLMCPRYELSGWPFAHYLTDLPFTRDTFFKLFGFVTYRWGVWAIENINFLRYTISWKNLHR